MPFPQQEVEQPKRFGVGRGVNDLARAKIDDRFMLLMRDPEGPAELRLDDLDEQFGERMVLKSSGLFQLIGRSHEKGKMAEYAGVVGTGELKPVIDNSIKIGLIS